MMFRKRKGLFASLEKTGRVDRFAISPPEFEAVFLRERALASRGQRSFTLVAFNPRDLDDQAILELIRLLKGRLRSSDVVGYLDPSRIAALLTETDERGAVTVANSIVSQAARVGLKFDYQIYSYSSRPQDPEGSATAAEDLPHSPPEESDDDSVSTVDGARASATRSAPSSRRTNGSHVPHSGNGNGRLVHAVVHEAGKGVNGCSTSDSINGGDPRTSWSTPSTQACLRTNPQQAAARIRSDVIGSPPRERARTEKRAPIGTELNEVRSTLGQTVVHDLRALSRVPIPRSRRAFDVLFSGILMILLAPLLVAVAIAIRISSPGPVIFKQQRAGQGGKPFWFYKFRSMRVDAEKLRPKLAHRNEQDGPIFKMRNDPRLTPIGRFLRKSSIDELPQLWNVMRGDMTLIGPRPPLLDEVEGYAPWQRERLNVRGGLTCIWQVSGRSEVGFEEWVRMDLRYAQRHSMFLDLGLLLRTAGAVVSGKGAY